MSNLNEHQWIEQAMLVIDALIERDKRFYRLIENGHENIYAVYKKEHPKDRVILTIDLLDNSVFRSRYHYGYDAYMITCDVCGIPERQRLAGLNYDDANTTWVIERNRCVWECLDRLTTVAGMLYTGPVFDIIGAGKRLNKFYEENKLNVGDCIFYILNTHLVRTEYLEIVFKEKIADFIVMGVSYEDAPKKSKCVLRFGKLRKPDDEQWCKVSFTDNRHKAYNIPDEKAPYKHDIYVSFVLRTNPRGDQIQLDLAFLINSKNTFFLKIRDINTLEDIKDALPNMDEMFRIIFAKFTENVHGSGEAQYVADPEKTFIYRLMDQYMKMQDPTAYNRLHHGGGGKGNKDIMSSPSVLGFI